MPSLPSLPGIPPLLSSTAAAVSGAINTATLIAADAALLSRLFAKSKWGIYLNGVAIAAADSIVSIEYVQDSKVSDYPVEAGGFQTYNKVATPYDARIQMTKGGNEGDRRAFLAAIEAAAASLNLYDIVTPERTYTSANIQKFDYKRTATNGAGMLTVELWLIEVRVTAQAAFTNTAKPSGASVVTVGTVQSQTPTQALSTKAGAPPLATIIQGAGKLGFTSGAFVSSGSLPSVPSFFQ